MLLRTLSATHEWFIFQLLCKHVWVAVEDTERRKCPRYNIGVSEDDFYGGAQAAAKPQYLKNMHSVCFVFFKLRFHENISRG